MKKIFLIFTLSLLLLLQCKKETSDKHDYEDDKQTIEYSDTNTGINFNAMKRKIDDSEKLSIEVFFAISVLHKNYILQFVDQVKNLSEEEQKDFFRVKKDDFFKSIKYSENEYNDFMQNNITQMNEYINRHKEIEEYLLSIN